VRVLCAAQAGVRVPRCSDQVANIVIFFFFVVDIVTWGVTGLDHVGC
jgi:hypothetical protein